MKKLLAAGGSLAIVAAAFAVILTIVAGIVAIGVVGGATGAVVAAAGKGSAEGASGGCGARPAVPAGDQTLAPPGQGPWNDEQIGNAKVIIGIGKSIGAPEQAWKIALMTAMQESTLRNLNYGDADSRGLFQQRPSTGWGTVMEITNPAYAAQAFYLGVGGSRNPGLLTIPRWETMGLGEAAQKVQRSAFPDEYDKWADDAQSILDEHAASAPKVPIVTTGAVNTSPGGVNADDGSDAPSCGGEVGSVHAAGDDYPGRDWTPDVGSVAGGLARECVDFTAWRMRQLTPGFDKNDPYYGTWYVLGNGAQWGSSASALGYKVDNNPKAGDIAYWGGGFGHVAFVAEVKANGNIIIEEYNMIIPGGGGASDYSYHTREISSGEPAGFIHFLDDPKHPRVPYGHSNLAGNAK